MTDLNKAIGFYHGLLDDEMARASNELLEEQQQRRGLFFGTRPLCSVIRPRFLTHDQYRFLQTAIRDIMPVFAKAHTAALTDASIRAQFMLADWEEKLVALPMPYRASSPTARMDSFFVPETGEWITLKVSSHAIRTISKLGIYQFIKKLEKKGDVVYYGSDAQGC